MNSNKVVVVVLRRELDPEKIRLIHKNFPGRAVEIHYTNPSDYKEHAEQCRKIKPDIVVLPAERPIPSLAMEEGFVHVIIKDGSIYELLPLRPEFKEFEPKT